MATNEQHRDEEQEEGISASQSQGAEAGAQGGAMKMIIGIAIVIIIIAAGLWLYFGGLGGSPDETNGTTSPEGAAAVVNGEPIAMADASSRLDQLASVAGGQISDKQKTQLQKRVVNQLVDRELVRQYAENNSISVSDKAFEKRYQQTISQIGGKEKLKQRLSQQGQSIDQFKKLLRFQLLVPKVVKDVNVTVSENELRNRYDQLKQQFSGNGTSSQVPAYEQMKSRLKQQLKRQKVVQQLRQNADIEMRL